MGATDGNQPESAAALSAGGFSNYWSQPDYQKSAVSRYLTSLGDKYQGKYNYSNRAYPDVSAAGENFHVMVNGNDSLVFGTSCASPTFASVISMLNDQLIAAGKPSLGFLNPWLYENPGMLNDITSGDNPGCGTKGFPAATGWDPVSNHDGSLRG